MEWVLRCLSQLVESLSHLRPQYIRITEDNFFLCSFGVGTACGPLDIAQIHMHVLCRLSLFLVCAETAVQLPCAQHAFSTSCNEQGCLHYGC